MEINYLCPKCRSYLNIGPKVVLSVQVGNNKKGLMLFEKKLGDYTIKKHELIEFKKGEIIDFYCPICHETLVSDIDPNLAKVILVDENDDEFKILFSKIAGEQATFKIKSGNLVAFGIDKDNYLELIKSKGNLEE